MADGVFKLKVELGDDAMRTRADVIEALEEVCGAVDGGGLTGAVRDLNGNTVGRWTVDGEIDDE